ncbi:arabinose efflux permease family protein [Saccharomonospora marina XMU15]|uniref:Arabinose efflux permease family protein n=2 Tax=Saccharomonospora TaxID=1851 RepID=H5X3X4_9PSEU|nr:arabinose efflux permease family protein [Saccharomonospora marina XMU15]
MRALAAVCMAQFMVVLDVSIVNVALPRIETALGLDVTASHWVVNAYTLVFAGLLLLGGRVADLYGHKRTLLAGLALFSTASLVGGLAGGQETLVAARAAQGLGAAVLAPATLTVVGTAFEGAARTRALAIWTGVGLAGGTAGNLVGGLLTQTVSWRAVLLVNVPIGVVAAWLARCLPCDRARTRPRLDLPGAALAVAVLVCGTFGLARAGTHGWSDPATVTALLACGCALALFVPVQTRWASHPLIPPRLLAHGQVARGNVIALVAGACLSPMWFFLAFSMQQVLQLGPLLTGLGFLPHTLLAIVFGVVVTPRLLHRVRGHTLLGVGALVAAAGFVWQSRLTPESGYLVGVLGPAVLIGVGSGLLNTPVTLAATSGVPRADAGAASGLLNTTKQVGAVLGLAVLTTVAQPAFAGPADLARGYGRAFAAMAAALLVVAVLAFTSPAVAATSDRDGLRSTR